MSADRGVTRAYGVLVALYPREFRDKYGSDMVQLVRDTCEDESPWRVWLRVVVDLAISIPTQHLETHMRRSTSHLTPLIYTAIAGAGIILALVGGTNVGLAIVGLVVALVAGTIAVVAWRRVAPIGGSVQTAHWWKLLLAGPLVIGSVVAAASFGVEAWFVGMIAVFLGLILTGTGLLLGLVRVATRRPPVTVT